MIKKILAILTFSLFTCSLVYALDPPAKRISVEDSGNLYTATNVETALAEVKTLADSTTSGLGESIDDRVDALIQDGTGISWTYNDTLNTLTPAVSL